MTPTSKSDTRLRIALFGAGRHAQHHAKAIMACPQVDLVAIADPSAPARTAMENLVLGLRSFETPEELISAVSPDVVHICTPPESHAPLAILALNSGCHIYVEKPFTEDSDSAEAILDMARKRGLLVCAGHQLLFEAPTRVVEKYLPAVGHVAHVESYFSFRPVRHAPGGRRVLRADLQLLDILPHPVYLLLRVLERCGKGDVELKALELSRAGTVHAVLRQGQATGTLVVTLEGRPVESYLRIIGTNGSLIADYVRGTVQRALGPGSSGIDKLLAPYRQARQLLLGSTIAFGRRFLKRQASYPGLVELFSAFYGSIRAGAAPPVTPQSLLDTVRICEQVARALAAAEAVQLAASTPRPMNGQGVLVTGGTGFLGKEIVKSLLKQGRPVRVLARRLPPGWERVPGTEYVAADIASQSQADWFNGIDTVIHAAAETAGGWDEHQRNSIDATESMIRGAASAGVRRFVQVSSLAVLSKQERGPLNDESPLEANSRGSGPYVWGKLESERLALQLGTELGVDVRVIRPGALLDLREFEPPGRLGKRIGNVFVAVGARNDRLGVIDVSQAGGVIAELANAWPHAPVKLNLIDPAQPSKRALIALLRESNPDIAVIWMPRLLLLPISWLALLAQKILQPNRPAINLAAVFAVRDYDPAGIKLLLSQSIVGK